MQPQIVEVPIQPQPMAHTQADGKPQNSDKPLYGRLFILKGLEPREIQIDSEQFVIGRAPEGECNFTIDMPYVSPKHCMIIHHDGRFSIRDLGGKNGTFVNGERISRDRDTAAPVGSEIGITKNITMELWDMETVISLESKLTSAAGMSTAVRSTERGDELRFKSVLGIKQVDDEEDIIPEDYSPV
jgi:pSer/pThr/pTyr-binding forkhead associated (FHA) protein